MGFEFTQFAPHHMKPDESLPGLNAVLAVVPRQGLDHHLLHYDVINAAYRKDFPFEHLPKVKGRITGIVSRGAGILAQCCFITTVTTNSIHSLTTSSRSSLATSVPSLWATCCEPVVSMMGLTPVN